MNIKPIEDEEQAGEQLIGKEISFDPNNADELNKFLDEVKRPKEPGDEEDEGADATEGEETEEPAAERPQSAKLTLATTNSIITEEDLGRTIGDVVHELEHGTLPPMTKEQQDLLDDYLFVKGYAIKTYGLPKGLTCSFRTTTIKLSRVVKAAMRERMASGNLSDAEYMIETNLIIVASQLAEFKGESTYNTEKNFSSKEAFDERLEFVTTGAYDGEGIPGSLFDRLVYFYNAFNTEVANLLSGKYLENFSEPQ